MKVFLVDIITVTKANCAVPMNYFESLLLTLLVFKAVVAAVLLLSWAIPKVKRGYQMRNRHVPRAVSVVASADPRRRRRRGTLMTALRFRVDWVKVFRVVSMVLFIAYPSVSVKIFKLFRCREVEGHYWLVADMRLQCFTSTWTAYAIYGTLLAT